MEEQQIMNDLSGYQSDGEGVASSKYELNHQSEFVSEVSDLDNAGNAEGEGEPGIYRREAEQHHNMKSLSFHCGFTDNETGKLSFTSWTAAVQEAIGVPNYDEPMNYALNNNNEENASVKNNIHDEDITFVGAASKAKGKGKEVIVHEELEIPRCPSPANPDQLFDPATYEARNFYVADASGSMRHVFDTDIIHWSKVTKPDGTTSFQCNAQFVKFSDGSLQLLIGDEVEGAENTDVKLLLEVAEVLRNTIGGILEILKAKLAFLDSRYPLTDDDTDSSDEVTSDLDDEQSDDEPLKGATLHTLNLVVEATAEMNIMNGGKEPKGIFEAGTSTVKVTDGSLYLPENETVEDEHEHRGPWVPYLT